MGAVDVLLVGEEYLEESSRESKSDGVFDDKITKKELKVLQTDIKKTLRPQYQIAPPVNLGSSGHGKLKADQWRTCIEFDIPISIAKLWSRETAPGNQAPDITARRDQLFRSVMHLAVAVRWGTSYRSSDHHSKVFTKNMKEYLQNLLDLYPHIQFRPNHHAALHIGPLLSRFGPVHGWWAFPFERVIGILQKIKTNDKIGK
jgi:hypothetical protein